MKRVFVLILVFAACAAFLWGVFFHFQFVYAYVIDPIVRIFWFVARLFLMIDQEVYWILLIFLSLGLLLWIVPRGQEELELTQKYADNARAESGLARWLTLYEQAAENPDALDKLELELGELEREIAALSLDRDEAEPGQAARVALHHGLERRGSFAGLIARLPGMKRRRKEKLLHEADQAIAKMESRLEMKNGKTK
jgi:signal transduction histidine kinase